MDRRRDPARRSARETTSGGDAATIAARRARRRRRRRISSALIAGGVLLGVVLVLAATLPRHRADDSPAVQRLGPSGSGDSRTPPSPAGQEGGRTPPSVASEPDVDRPEPTHPPAQARTGAVAELDQLLAAYDAALGELAASPAAAVEVDHPLVVRWHQLVAVGSELDQAMRARIRDDVVERSMVVRPGPDGESFSTRALRARVDDDGGIDFEHCGYSPGVGVHVATGEVLDDQRATSSGTGRAERDPSGALVLVALHDEQVRLLEPGETDPCTATATIDHVGGGS